VNSTASPTARGIGVGTAAVRVLITEIGSAGRMCHTLRSDVKGRCEPPLALRFSLACGVP